LGGEKMQKAQRRVAARGPTATSVARFRPTSAKLDPHATEEEIRLGKPIFFARLRQPGVDCSRFPVNEPDCIPDHIVEVSEVHGLA
jgi:hypothetical protein